ncbi:MAG: IS66 family transposase [Myxococcaceae bacterium]
MPETALAPPTVEQLAEQLAALKTERDEYKRLYVSLMEAYRKLEAGLVRHNRERFVGGEEQVTLPLLGMLTGHEDAVPAVAEATTQVEAYDRAKPTGRKPLPDKLPRIHVEVLPLEVQRAGLDAFHRIGEDVSETVEHRRASLVVVRTVRPKYVAKDKLDALQKEGDSTPVLQASAPELPIPRALAGPGLLADTIVRRWQDHLPLHRLERVYGREGLPLARSTMCGWHAAVAELARPLVAAMFRDAQENSPYLCLDATGVLVQAPEKCRRGHFFVLVAPAKHVLFQYTPKHDGKAVDKLLGDYQGFLVADAHSVYEHLYADGIATEVACWAHARRYVFKAMDSDVTRARYALALIQALFGLEREWKLSSPEERWGLRQEKSKPIVEAFFRWCDEESLKVLDETPISKAIGYARNQREALCRFLIDGRLPIHNNISENALRRQALGRKNWLFLGTDEGGDVNATLVTLLASCEMHRIEPLGYLRDLLCLLPSWSVQQVLDLAPASWSTTLERPEVQAQLEANVFRQAALGTLEPEPAVKKQPPLS